MISPAPAALARFKWTLGIVFFFSGAAGLVYQVAWQRLLTLHYGVGSVSVTLIVSVYMFGLGLGALAGGWLGERVRRRIGLYVLIEFLMGCFGLSSLSFLGFIGRSTAGSGYGWSLAGMTLFLSAPTFLMGMTLPLLTKIFNAAIRDFPRTVSFLYFVNTLGAAAGCLAAGYGLISFWGLDRAVYAAAAVNLALALLIYIAGKNAPAGTRDDPEGPAIPERAYSLGRSAYILVFVSGFLAIGYEIVWFRVVGVLVKASPYAFCTSLSVYLAGIALGSLWMNRRLGRRSETSPKDLFFLLQFLIALAVLAAFTGYDLLTRHTDLAVLTRKSFAAVLHPDGAAISFASVRSFLSGFYRWTDVLFWPGFFMFVPTFMMGASFPLLASMAPAGHEKEAKSVGTVYFFNICGNVLGGVITGFFLLAVMGTEHTLLLFIIVGLVLGLFVSGVGGKRLRPFTKVGVTALIAAALVLFFPAAGGLYTTLHTPPWAGAASAVDEGVEGVVMTFWKEERVRTYINGLAHGGRPNYGFYYETIEAVSHASRAENVLIIGFGTGSVTEMVLRADTVKKVTLVELNRTLIRNLKRLPLFSNMLSDGRISLIIDDGRRFLLQNETRFDLILIDPLRSTTAYSNNLYSRRFLELARSHLAPGGVFMIWMDEYRVMPGTVGAVFPHVRMYNSFCLASEAPLTRNRARYGALLAAFTPAERPIVQGSGWYVGDETHVRKQSAGYPVNEDWRPVCEYYLGLWAGERLGWYGKGEGQ